MNIKVIRNAISDRKILFFTVILILGLLLFTITIKHQARRLSSQYTISNRLFFFVENDTDRFSFSGLKVSSTEELKKCYKENYPSDMQAYLRSLTNMTFESSFVYITRNATLQGIYAVPGMHVRAARLGAVSKPGFGVYVLSGDPKSIIKPTD